MNKNLLIGIIAAVTAAIIIVSIIMSSSQSSESESAILAKRQAIKEYMKDMINKSTYAPVSPH